MSPTAYAALRSTNPILRWLISPREGNNSFTRFLSRAALSATAAARPLPYQEGEVDLIIARSTRGGDIGSSVIRIPVARYSALAAAAGPGTIATSPTPRIPSGWSGLGTSTTQVSISGRSRQVGIR